MKISKNSLYKNLDYSKLKKSNQQALDLSHTTFFSSVDLNDSSFIDKDVEKQLNTGPRHAETNRSFIDKSALSERGQSNRNLDYYVVNGNNKRKLK